MLPRSRPADGGAPLPTILDVFGSLPQFHLIDSQGKSKGAQTLVTALERRTEVDEHQRLAIPAQAILQEVRQL